MDNGSAGPTGKTPAHIATESSSRLFFIDHWRASVVILVVLHHVAKTYSGLPFYYSEPSPEGSLTPLLMLSFMALNQAWFMGALFLLAGYFVPDLYDRKGLGSFVKGRLIRLGIPLITYIVVLHPALLVFASHLSGAAPQNAPSTTQSMHRGILWLFTVLAMLSGVLWFVAMLFVFSLGYAFWRTLTRKRPPHSPSESSPPSYVGICLFVLALALVTYLFRIIVPLGKAALGFPTLHSLPQYVSFFVLGTIAYRRNWLRTVPNSMGIAGSVAAALVLLTLFPLTWLGGQFMGNGTLASAGYALFDSIFAVGLCMGLTTLFRRCFDGPGRIGRFLAQHSYTVYVVHMHVVVGLTVAMRGLAIPTLLKFALASVIGVPLCFAVAFIVRKIPGVSRVL